MNQMFLGMLRLLAQDKQEYRKVATQAKVRSNQSAHAEPLVVGQRVWVKDRNRHGQGKLCHTWVKTLCCGGGCGGNRSSV